MSESSSSIHNNLLTGVLHAPQYFHDTVPTGRILNRCVKDVNEVDHTLGQVLQDLSGGGITVFGTVALLLIVLPASVFPIAIISCFYYYVQSYFLPASRELRRLDARSRSPIYQHIQESSIGLISIRAFEHNGAIERAIEEMDRRINENCRIYLLAFAVNRWLGVRLESIAAGLVLIASVMSLLFVNSIAVGLLALVVTTTLTLSGELNWFVRQTSVLAVQMNSVERMLEYTKVEPEGSNSNITIITPNIEWPQSGAIHISNLSIAYSPQPNAQTVLTGISCDIRAGEKIGVVGRTGAGKVSKIRNSFALITFSTLI